MGENSTFCDGLLSRWSDLHRIDVRGSRRILIMYNPNNIQIGDVVKVKEHNWIGKVVGAAFGKPITTQVRLQLSCGLTYDAYPSQLENYEENTKQ